MQPISSPPGQLALVTAPVAVKKTTLTNGSADVGPCGSSDNIDRFSLMPDSLVQQTQEWLDSRDKFQLIQVTKRVNDLLQRYFRNRLNPDLLKSREPLSRTYATLYYQSPDLRRGRYLLSDQTGLNYLCRQGVYYPLAEKIRTEQITIEEAVQYRLLQTRSITSSLTDPDLTPRQKRFLQNRVFSEHIISGRCSLSSVREMSYNTIYLFYSMTLQQLFKTGRLELNDLDDMSCSGIGLLHDPLGVDLYTQCLISKQQVLDLTPTQFKSVLMCLPALIGKQLSIAPVLALDEQQIKFLQKTGLGEQVRRGRVTLAQALKGVNLKPEAQITLPCTGSIPPFNDIINSSANVRSRIDWLKTFGPTILALPCDEILRYFNCTSDGYESIFEHLNHGFDVPALAELANSYIDLCIDLAKHLSSKDYLRVMEPFIKVDFGTIIAESFRTNATELIKKCSLFWSLVRSSTIVTGADISKFLEPAASEFDACIDDGVMTLSAAGIIAFGQLLALMNLAGAGLLFEDWPETWNADNWPEESWIATGADASIADYFQALISPYETDNEAAASFMAAIDRRRPR